jgi:tRNA-uridine aminocarboxypropyltransferase
MVIELDREVQQRCYECFRPKPLCFCAAIPRIDNRTDVLILQHVGERSHPFNTARIVKKALRRCELIADHNQRFGDNRLPIAHDAGLLYPAANARSLNDIPVAERPSQLVIIDGTWNQAKTIVRDVPQLRELPCYRLAPTSPGQYRIRLEPDAQSLSTLEATVAALNDLEPETAGLNQLLAAFNEMVESQLGQLASHSVWRKRKVREATHRHLPRKLLQDADRLVIAYGEATPSKPGQRIAKPLPVNWIARRLGTSEPFSCCVQQQHPLPDTVLKYMRLSADDFANAISPDEFCSRWAQFLQPNDTLVVYHQRTYDLLRNIGAMQPHCLMLKSTFGKWQSGVRSLEELVAKERVALPSANNKNRADQRLDMAIALVEHLRLG